MTNFVTGMLVGMATVGVIIIAVDQLRGRGFNLNPIDILGGVLVWLWDRFYDLANYIFKACPDRGTPEYEALWSDAHYVPDGDYLFECEEQLAREVDPDMEFINSMVNYCEGKVS